MDSTPFKPYFRQLFSAANQTQPAKTVEVFGWIIFVEAGFMLISPAFVATVLHLPPLVEQAENYFRLIGVLVGGLGMLYIASGRMNAEGFVFASLLDRPLVPIIMFILWRLDILPGPLAAAFSVQDFASFLWTLSSWIRAHRSV